MWGLKEKEESPKDLGISSLRFHHLRERIGMGDSLAEVCMCGSGQGVFEVHVQHPDLGLRSKGLSWHHYHRGDWYHHGN